MFTRIKPANWALNEKLTSAQMNALDIDHANSLDKSSAGDTLLGTISLASAAAIINVTNGGAINIGSGNGQFNILNGSIATVNNANFSFTNGAQLNFHSSADCTFDSGCVLTINGSLSCLNTASFGASSIVTFNHLVASAVGSSWTLAGPIALNGAVTINGTTSITGTSVITGIATFGNTTSFNSTTSLNGVTTTSDLTILGTNRLKVTSRSITRTFSTGVPYINYNDSDIDTAIPSFLVYNGTATQNFPAIGGLTFSTSVDLNLPHNSVINSILVTYLPDNTHSALPSSLPNITISKFNIITGVGSSISTITDSPGTVGAYETLRTLTISSLSETVNRTIYKYLLRFDGESGSNAKKGLQFYGGKIVLTITEYDEASL